MKKKDLQILQVLLFYNNSEIMQTAIPRIAEMRMSWMEENFFLKNFLPAPMMVRSSARITMPSRFGAKEKFPP